MKMVYARTAGSSSVSANPRVANAGFGRSVRESADRRELSVLSILSCSLTP